MPWQSLIVAIDANHAEPLSDALLDAGALSVAVEDAHAGTADEEPLFGEPGSPVDRVWSACVIRALLDEGVDAALVLGVACATIELPLPPWRIEIVPDDDWVQRTQSQFAPIQVSPRLWIVPSWHQAVDPDAINIALDPGLAFGTGSHPTTQLCLRWLESVVQDGETVLDYGCGSGILAIAAAKFGAQVVTGVDIDPAAITAARANAANNAVVAQFLLSDQPLTLQADIVVANILANPLLILAPALAQCVRPGGRLALAGLLDEQATNVAAAYAAHFEMRIYAASEGWTCLTGVRKDTA